VTSPLRRPAFSWFFAGRLTSQLGSAMAPVALAFAVLDVSDRPPDLGTVLAANLVPHLLLLLVGGATADRFSRRTVLITANVGSALTQGAVAVILLTGNCSLALIAGLEFANGALAAFTTPALRGVVPKLVDRDQLQKANALLGSTRNATRIIGPTTAGVVVAAAGSGQAIAIEAITYAIAAGCLLRLDASKTTTAARTPVGRNIREGASYFRSVRWLWPVSLAFFVVNLVQTGPWQILAPHIVSQHGGPQVWGLVLSSRAVGLLVMSVVMYRLVIRYPLRVTILSGAMAAVPLLSLGLGQPTGVVIVAVVLGGACASASAITWDSTLQEHIPHDKLSRVASIDDLLSYAAIPVGQLAAAGPLAASIGAPTVCLACALVCTAATSAALLNRSVRDLEHGEPQANAGFERK